MKPISEPTPQAGGCGLRRPLSWPPIFRSRPGDCCQSFPQVLAAGFEQYAGQSWLKIRMTSLIILLVIWFVLGHLVMAAPGLVDAVRRNIGLAFTLAISGVVAIFVLNGPEVLATSFGSWTWLTVLILVLVLAQAWGWVLGVWAAGMRFAAFACPLPRLVAAAAMPFFVLH
jgi:hypothetical protein